MKKIRMNSVPIWKEERNFTKWLAINIDCVGEIIGKKIVSAENEVNESSKYGKGKYPVDILAIDENGEKLVIENQYYLSNHLHLGEIITYAAWNEVNTIIWITEDIDEEHYRAVEYIKKLASQAERNFEFWVLLVSPDVNSDLEEEPNIILKVASKDDCIKKNTNIVLPQNAELNITFWDRFESVFPKEYGFSLTRTKRTDCINLSWGKSYNMNIPFRKKGIKVEVHFKTYGEIFYDAINCDLDKIKEELHLGPYEKISLIPSPCQIRVEIPAQVTNIDKWDEYIQKVITVILKLREIADRYEFCF